MNTHDIELPPLPAPGEALSKWAYDESDMQAYALAAVEADRKRRGEPVAYMFADEWGRTKIVLGKETAEHWCPPDENITPLYTAPQPAEPVDGKHPPEVQAAWHAGWEAGQDALRESMAAGAADG